MEQNAEQGAPASPDTQPLPVSTTKKPAPHEVVGGCFVMLLVIAGLIWLFSSCSCLDSNSGMVNPKDSEKKQAKQAEKLKPDAYIISQQFMKERLKDPDSAKFPAFPELKPQQVIWARDNEFVILSVCRAKNGFGAYDAQPYGAWVEYCGDGKWSCLFIGDQEKTIGKALPELANLADEEKAKQDELLRKKIEKLAEDSRNEEAQKRFKEWKSKIVPYKKGMRLSTVGWYYIPSDMALYQNQDCTTVTMQVNSGHVFKIERPYPAKVNAIRVTIYLFKEGIVPEKPAYAGFLKMMDLTGDMSANQVVNTK